MGQQPLRGKIFEMSLFKVLNRHHGFENNFLLLYNFRLQIFFPQLILSSNHDKKESHESALTLYNG